MVRVQFGKREKAPFCMLTLLAEKCAGGTQRPIRFRVCVQVSVMLRSSFFFILSELWKSIRQEVGYRTFLSSFSAEKFVGSVVPRKSGGYVIAEGTRFAALDWDKQKITTIVDVQGEKSNNRFNDGKVDPAGRFFAGVNSMQV